MSASNCWFGVAAMLYGLIAVCVVVPAAYWPGKPRLARMGLLRQDGVEALALREGEARADRVNDLEVRGMHRLGVRP
jgi:hypothetical protein